MKHKILGLLTLMFIGMQVYSQIANRYGINLGLSYATQLWQYTPSVSAFNTDYKIGLQTFMQAEKDMNEYLALRAEVGYIQKGFRKSIQIINDNGTPGETKNCQVILHDAALNIALKIKPINSENAPYLIAGARGDYMIAYRDIELTDPSGNKIKLYESTLREFKKINAGALLGIGLSLKDKLYLEIEYNPSFTKNLDNDRLSVTDRSWGLRIGINVNRIPEK